MVDAPPREIGVTEYGIPIRNVWHMLLYAWSRTKDLGRWRTQVERAPSLDGLLARILAGLVEQRLRIGLGREYVQVERRSQSIRGRIDFTRSLLDRTFERGEVHCRYESFETDAPRNQILRSVLARLGRVGRFGPHPATANDLRARLRRLVRELDGITITEVDVDLIRRQQLGRNDRDYQLMLSICEFLLQNVLPTEWAGARSSPSIDRNALTLHDLFERFVAAFYKHHLHGWGVTKQASLSWPVESDVAHLPGMRPDLVLVSKERERVIVLDTKFTAKSLKAGGWGGVGYDSSHLYQLYAYLRTQEGISEGHRAATGILLYPQAGTALSDSFVMQGHDIRIETVDLAASWEEVEQRLLRIVP